MYKGLLRTLTYMYQFITLGRERLGRDDVESMANAASAMVGRAPEVLEPEADDDLAANKLTLEQAELVDRHIEEMVAWINHLEIV